MEKIDFNDQFAGFSDKENILVDTSIILALLNKYDTWHVTVIDLFNDFIFNSDHQLYLYVTPTILNEIAHLSSKPLSSYMKNHPDEKFTDKDKKIASRSTVKDVRDMVNFDLLLILDGTKESSLIQLDLSEALGSADALNASVANHYGSNFLTLDSRLATNILNHSSELSKISKVYYTTGIHKTY